LVQRDEACTAQRTVKGKVRCLPAAHWGVTHYTDSACTTRVARLRACANGSSIEYAKDSGADIPLTELMEFEERIAPGPHPYATAHHGVAAVRAPA